MTDFGLKDSFVGVMKGVLAVRARKARAIDLTHDLPPQDVSCAALTLMTAVPYFPRSSLFVSVVDPGVGSKRRILWARTKSHSFLAPDNGLLSWIPEPVLEFRSVENRSLFLPNVSGTFHGRDIFAPVAAALWRGLSPSKLGPEISDPVTLPWPSEGRIMAFDRFGNAVTSIRASSVGRGDIRHGSRSLGPLRTHYAEVPEGRPLAVAGSSGLVELSVRGGDYSARTRARIGDPVHVRHR